MGRWEDDGYSSSRNQCNTIQQKIALDLKIKLSLTLTVKCGYKSAQLIKKKDNSYENYFFITKHSIKCLQTFNG